MEKSPRNSDENAANKGSNNKGMRCAVPNCNKYSQAHKGLPFHKFPRDDERRAEWLRIVNREDLLGLTSTDRAWNSKRVCNDHFLDSQFRFSKDRKSGLLPLAVPYLDDSLLTSTKSPPKRKKKCKKEAAIDDTDQPEAPLPPESSVRTSGRIKKRKAMQEEAEETTLTEEHNILLERSKVAKKAVEVNLINTLELHLPRDLTEILNKVQQEEMQVEVTVNGKQGLVSLLGTPQSIVMKIKGQTNRNIRRSLCVLHNVIQDEVDDDEGEMNSGGHDLPPEVILTKEDPEVQDHSYPLASEKTGVVEEEAIVDLFTCVLCEDAVDFNESRMTEHVREGHDLSWQQYQLTSCDYCHFCRVKMTSTVKQHCKAQHPMITVTGYFSMEGKAQAEKDAYVTAPAVNRCAKCTIVFDTPDEAAVHAREMHPVAVETVEAMPCSLCERTFGTSGEMSVHMYKVHPFVLDSGQVACEHCSEVFRGKQLLRKHLPVCPVKPVFICFPCNKMFETNDECQTHLQNHPWKYFCDTCGATFSTRSSLFFHCKYKHSRDEESHHCEICGKTFATKYQVRRHITRAHTDERNFVCEQCGSAFKSRHHLVTHVQKIHDNIYPHYCSTCGLGFSTLAGVDKHRCTGIHFKSRAEKSIYFAKKEMELAPQPQMTFPEELRVENVPTLGGGGECVYIEDGALLAEAATLFLHGLEEQACVAQTE